MHRFCILRSRITRIQVQVSQSQRHAIGRDFPQIIIIAPTFPLLRWRNTYFTLIGTSRKLLNSAARCSFALPTRQWSIHYFALAGPRRRAKAHKSRGGRPARLMRDKRSLSFSLPFLFVLAAFASLEIAAESCFRGARGSRAISRSRLIGSAAFNSRYLRS